MTVNHLDILYHYAKTDTRYKYAFTFRGKREKVYKMMDLVDIYVRPSLFSKKIDVPISCALAYVNLHKDFGKDNARKVMEIHYK